VEQSLSYFLMAWTDPYLVFLTAAGTFAGIYVGVIPGLSVTMAVSILISFTFTWDVNEALAVMAGVFLGGVYGGSRTAIMINIPGAPAAIAAGFDGYPLAKLGLAGMAIGVSTTVSFFGALFGIAILAAAAPIVSEFSLMFAPRDYLLLAILGILLIGALSGESLAKGIFCGVLGILIGTVGLDPISAQPRLTFGSTALMGGIHYVAAMIGFFGISEVLVQTLDLKKKIIKQNVDRILPSWKVVLKHLPLSMRCSAIGTVIGALPGAGGDIAALMAYGHAVRSVKKPTRPFGEGAVEGVVAPEAACSSAVGGAYIPMMTLGIPGDAVTAVLIGALYIHGLKPGPMLMIETPHLFWFTVGNLVMASIFLLIFGLTGIRAFAKMVEMPPALLMPIIVILSVVGTYSIQNSVTDVYWMLAFGIFGYFLKTYGFQIGPIILGVILGPLMDVSYRRAIITVRGDLGDFFLDLLVNPISLVLTVGMVALLVGQTPAWKRYAEKRKAKKEASGSPRNEAAGSK
jgi:putative tricarboxylic transport membrane protein